MISLTPKPSQRLFVYRIQSKEKILQKKGLFFFKGNVGVEDWRKNEKKGF